MVVDILSVFEDTGHSLNERDQLVKILPEFGDIGDLEDDIGLSFLGEATPTQQLC